MTPVYCLQCTVAYATRETFPLCAACHADMKAFFTGETLADAHAMAKAEDIAYAAQAVQGTYSEESDLT